MTIFVKCGSVEVAGVGDACRWDGIDEMKLWAKLASFYTL